MFLSFGLYGSRPWSHFAIHRAPQGWIFLEWGPITLELDL